MVITILIFYKKKLKENLIILVEYSWTFLKKLFSFCFQNIEKKVNCKNYIYCFLCPTKYYGQNPAIIIIKKK